MNRRALLTAAAFAMFAGTGPACAQEQAPPAVNYSPMRWHDLAPGGWDVRTIYSKFELTSLWDLPEDDPHLRRVMHDLAAALDEAPSDRELDGRPVKLHGFAIVLKGTSDAVREFLLVPWQVACAHTPPPAANQRVRVIAAQPLRGLDPNRAIYVWGRLAARTSTTSAGKAGYTLAFERLEPYDWQTTRRADW